MCKLRREEVLASGLHLVTAVKSGMDCADSRTSGYTVPEPELLSGVLATRPLASGCLFSKVGIWK